MESPAQKNSRGVPCHDDIARRPVRLFDSIFREDMLPVSGVRALGLGQRGGTNLQTRLVVQASPGVSCLAMTCHDDGTAARAFRGLGLGPAGSCKLLSINVELRPVSRHQQQQ